MTPVLAHQKTRGLTSHKTPIGESWCWVRFPQSCRETWGGQIPPWHGLDARMLIVNVELLIILKHTGRHTQLGFPNGSLQFSPYFPDIQIHLWPLPPSMILPDRSGSASLVCSMKCPGAGKGLPHHSPARDEHHSSHQLTD